MFSTIYYNFIEKNTQNTTVSVLHRVYRVSRENQWHDLPREKKLVLVQASLKLISNQNSLWYIGYLEHFVKLKDGSQIV